MTPEQLLEQVEFFGSARASAAVAHAASDLNAAANFEAEATTALHKVQAEIERLYGDMKTMRRGYEINQTSLLAKLAEVRTGKSRAGDGVDRRRWTDEQWLEEARSIFYDGFGGAGDLLNGHISAMWKQINSAKKEQEQLAAIVAATLRQLGAVLGVNIGEEIRKARPEQSPGWPPPSGAERQLTIDTAHMREPIAGHCIRCREDSCDGCFYCTEQKRAK